MILQIYQVQSIQIAAMENLLPFRHKKLILIGVLVLKRAQITVNSRNLELVSFVERRVPRFVKNVIFNIVYFIFFTSELLYSFSLEFLRFYNAHYYFVFNNPCWLKYSDIYLYFINSFKWLGNWFIGWCWRWRYIASFKAQGTN